MNKYEIKLSERELEDACLVHKEMIESLARIGSRHNNDKNFEIFSVAIAFTISLTLTNLGINKIEPFLSDMTNTIKNIHEEANKNACYMEYREGKKISEGRFN